VKPRIVRRPQAKADLINHFVYLHENAGRETARRFLRAAKNSCEFIAEIPELGALKQFEHPDLEGVRMWPVKGFREYLLFYVPIPSGIRLIRVIHAKQDYWRVLNQ
jgi:toxin ParE1/3/4